MDRRDFLKSLGCVFIAELVPNPSIVDYENIFLFGEPKNLVKKIEETNTPEYSRKQFFVSYNPRLKQSFNSKGYCYVIGHASYATYDNNEVVVGAVKDVEKYGKYALYLTNISKLIQYLNNSDELAIFAIDEKDIHNKNIPQKELRPDNSAMIIVTENGYSTFEEYVLIENEVEKQNPDLMFEFLRKNDIKEVRFAGEWAWWYGKRYSDEERLGGGCLSGIAKNFDGDFKIKGIEGCIFPSIPKTFTKVLEKLYNDQIPLDAILNK